MKTIRHKTCCLLLLPAILLSGNALGERLYKWVDAEGQVHYSNRLPPEAAKQRRELINEQGRTVKVYRAPLTAEEKLEEERLKELEKKKRELAEKRAIHDRSLLATYSNTDDMYVAMQGKLEAVESLIKLTNSRVNSLQNRLLELTEEAASYERSGRQLPDNLQRQISNLRNQIDQNKAFVEDKKLEMEDIRLQSEADIRRFKELTTDKPDTATRQKQLSALEAAEANPAIELTRHDRTLLATYGSEEDLLFARDEEVSNLNATINDTASRLDTMQIHLAELSDNIDEYQVRNEIPPDNLVNRMKELIREIAATQATLEQQRSEKQALDDKFANDITRFHRLTAATQQ
jgi:chromosome segregation ATPase